MAWQALLGLVQMVRACSVSWLLTLLEVRPVSLGFFSAAGGSETLPPKPQEKAQRQSEPNGSQQQRDYYVADWIALPE